jgi:hypothetical protein
MFQNAPASVVVSAPRELSSCGTSLPATRMAWCATTQRSFRAAARGCTTTRRVVRMQYGSVPSAAPFGAPGASFRSESASTNVVEPGM